MMTIMKNILLALALLLLVLLLNDNVTNAQQLPEDRCNDALTCLNGGICVKSTNSNGDEVMTCYCSDLSEGRFVGATCDIPAPTDEKDWCNSYGDFCLNDGVCNGYLDEFNPAVCICKNGFTGKYCELGVDSSPVKDHISDVDNDNDIDETDIEESCTLQCINGGVCSFGYRDPTEAELTMDYNLMPEDVTENFQHCQCPPGTMGRKCEFEVDICSREDDNDDDDDDDDDDDAQHYCHNGATCVKTTALLGDTVPPPGMALPPMSCNCSAATEKNPGKAFTGAYCEYSDVVFCNAHDENVDERTFCANGGECGREGRGENAVWLCVCTDDFTGKHCEVPKNGVSSYPTTHYNPENENGTRCDDSICQNNGKCFYGMKDSSNTTIGKILEKEGEDLGHIMTGMANLLGANTTKAAGPVFPFMQHCVCPSGFTGPHCQNKFTTCPGGDHVCFHGTTCVEGEDRCSCNNNNNDEDDEDDNSFAGKFCQHIASITCGIRHHCFNGASCNGNKCKCAEGFRGARCEHSMFVNFDDDGLMTESKLTEGYMDRMNPNLILVSGLIALLGIIIIVIAVAYTNRRQETHETYYASGSAARSSSSSSNNSNSGTPATPPPPPPASVFSPTSPSNNKNNKNNNNNNATGKEEEAAAAAAENSNDAAELL